MPFGSEQWMYASGGFYPYEIDQSLRFNDNDTAYLSRTPATSSNKKTWTWSGWVKRGNLNSNVALFSAHDPTFGSSPNRRITLFRFKDDNTLHLFNRYYPSTTVYDSAVITNAVFRDSSAWYHVVLAFDTTEVTASDRVKIYVNGVLQSVTTSGSGYPEYNIDYAPNCDQIHQIGRYSYSQAYPYDGYMSEVNFIDGQALDATDFGEFKSGVWVPKEYEGTYGTNGFYLDFGNSGSLGADSSGNGNDWTANNLAATDQVSDSPTNNFCTLNTLKVGSNLALSEGNLKLGAAATGAKMVSSTFGVTTGKWYWESVITNPQQSLIGVENGLGSPTEYVGQSVNGWSYDMYTGDLYNSGSVSYGDTFTTNDVIGIAVDIDSGKLWFSKNGTWQNSGSPTDGTNPAATNLAGTIFPAFTPYNQYAACVANFGQDSSFAGNKTAQGNTDANGIGDFYYAPPAGYLALCTANLPDPAIDPAQDDVPADYFNTVLYTGTGSSGHAITGVGFQPDLVWIKSRSSAANHGLHDVLRVINGNEEILYSNLTNAGNTGGAYLSSFDSDGFTVNNNSSGNASGVTYAGWNWLAGGSGVTNTDGTITSTVSANQKAGFSIVSYTSSGFQTDTVGHGLSEKPDLVIYKNRDAVLDWFITFDFIDGSHDYMRFTTAVAAAASSPLPTSTTISPLGFNSGQKAVAYCFHSVDGYSKIGSYTGNGSTDGPFVYTGFRPAFVMLKASTRDASWIIVDAERDQYNVASKRLLPNSSSAEASGTHNIDFLSNGFKMRGDNNNSNGSGETYIFMVFAEMPFKYSNGR